MPLPLVTLGRWKRGSRAQTRRSFGGGADLHLRRRPRRPRGAIHQCERWAPVAMGGPLSLGPPPLSSSRLPYTLTHTGCVHSSPRGSFKCFSSNPTPATPPPSYYSYRSLISLPLPPPSPAPPPRVRLVVAATVGKVRRRGRRASPVVATPPPRPNTHAGDDILRVFVRSCMSYREIRK